MARLLRQMGDEVAFVGMLDTYNPAESGEVSRISLVVQRAGFHARNLLRAGPRHIAGYMREKLRVARDGELAHLIGSGAKNGKLEISDRDIINEDPGSVSAVQEINDLAVARFQPQPYDGAIVIYKPQVNYSFMPDPQMGWSGLARGGVSIVELPVNPHAMLVEPFVKHLAEDLAQRLQAVTSPSLLSSPVSA
jgi:thioesterase domain-containing protein